MWNWVKKALGLKRNIGFEFERLNENELLLKFSNGKEQVVTNEEFKAFLRSNHVKLQGLQVNMKDHEKMARFMQGLVDQFLDDRDAGKSQAGERVWLRVLSDTEVPSTKEENIMIRTCEYEIVGFDTEKVHETDTITAHTDVSGEPAKFNLVDLQMALTILAWSGVHATKEDQRHYFEVLKRDIPEDLKEEAEVTA